MGNTSEQFHYLIDPVKTMAVRPPVGTTYFNVDCRDVQSIAGRDPSWCVPNSEYYKLLATFFVPRWENKLRPRWAPSGADGATLPTRIGNSYNAN